jgi:hypothetical protein
MQLACRNRSELYISHTLDSFRLVNTSLETVPILPAVTTAPAVKSTTDPDCQCVRCTESNMTYWLWYRH